MPELKTVGRVCSCKPRTALNQQHHEPLKNESTVGRYRIVSNHWLSAVPNLIVLSTPYRRTTLNYTPCQYEGGPESQARLGGGQYHRLIQPRQLYRVIYVPSRWLQLAIFVLVIVFSVKVSFCRCLLGTVLCFTRELLFCNAWLAEHEKNR